MDHKVYLSPDGESVVACGPGHWWYKLQLPDETDNQTEGVNNIFADAKFSKRYLTRNGKVAIYCRELHGLHYLVFEGSTFTWEYDDNGLLYSQIDKGLDIVKCLELIDDELKDIAIQVAHKMDRNKFYQACYKILENECIIYFDDCLLVNGKKIYGASIVPSDDDDKIVEMFAIHYPDGICGAICTDIELTDDEMEELCDYILKNY